MKVSFDITDFGAHKDAAVNTEAIQRAVLACKEQGGGVVVIPAGTFYTGSIELFSNVTLQLQNGAVLKSTGKKEDFPYIGFWHNEMHETTSLLWAREQENITICGEGIIDLSSEITYQNITHMGYSVEHPEQLSSERRAEGVLDKNEDRVNQPIFFESCKNIKVRDVKIVRSACWTVVFSRSEEILVDGIVIDNHLNIQNNDGVHLSACKNAVISNCQFSCADDCIALTCITAHEGCNENVTITNCVMRSRSAAVRIGHNTKRVTVSNLNVYETNRGIAIFAGEKNTISDIQISHVQVHTALLAGAWWGKAEPLVICAAAPESKIERVTVSDMTGVCENGIVVYGKNHNIQNLRLQNIHMQVQQTPYYHEFCDGLDLRPYAYEKNAEGPFLLHTQGVGSIIMSDTEICLV